MTILEVPEHFGPIVLEAFIDLDGNMGSDQTDPMGAYSGNPLRVGDRSVSNVDITLEVQPDGRMPRKAARQVREIEEVSKPNADLVFVLLSSKQ